MAEGETGINAGVGAAVTVAAGMTGVGAIVAPLLGGGVAGYLQGGSRADGAMVGALSGLIALVPAVAALAFFGVFLGFFALEAGGPGTVGLLAMLAVLGGIAAVTVGLGAVGGWIGNYVKFDTDIGS